ncbi:unnamed protein product [Penicillium manginii]
MLLRKFIRNEAIEKDPPEIYNLRTILISLVVLSVIQAGAFAGCFLSMWLANRVGRRVSLIIASILVFIGVALQAGASGYIASLYVGRFIAGVAIGIASSVNPLYVSENAPRGIRGLLTGFYQLSIVTGLTLAFWINYGCTLHIEGPAQYIIPLSLQALPAIILFIGMLFANESPRFLAMKSPEKALAVLSKLRGLSADHPYVRGELEGIILQLEEERSLTAQSSGLLLIKEAFTIRSNRRRTFLCITLMMWSNLTGTNAMTYYSPDIFSSMGLSGSSAGLFATGIYGIVKIVACFIFIVFVTDSLGRRKSLLWTGIVQGLMLFYIGFYIRFDPPSGSSGPTSAGYVALAAIYLFAAAYQFGWGPVVWTYCSEIPAARLRPLQMGMATASQWLFNFVVAKATPNMFATLGVNGFGTYFIYGSFCFTMVVFAWFFVPETKGNHQRPCISKRPTKFQAGLSLENMNELFEQNNLRGKFTPSRFEGGGNDRELKSDSEVHPSIEHVDDVQRVV